MSGSDSLPPRALDPALPKKPAPKPSPHDRRLTRLPENARGRFTTAAALARRIAAEHAARCVAAAKDGTAAPELDEEAVGDLCEFAVRGVLG